MQEATSITVPSVDRQPSTERAFCPNGCTAITHTVSEAFAGIKGPWRVVQCQRCGIKFSDPRPPLSDWHLYYSDDYTPYQTKAPPRWDKRISLATESFLARHVAGGPFGFLAPIHLHPSILPPFGRRRMVDIGCGGADYLARLRSAGWQVLGLEPSAYAAEQARQAYGVEVIHDSFPSKRLEPHSFDLVTSQQVLEHMLDPVGALRAMYDLLVPGGRVLLTVPNADSWSAKLFQTAWIGWDLPRHLTHFTPKTLREMLEQSGFQVETLRTLMQGGWVRESAARAVDCGLPRNRQLFRQRQISDTFARLACWVGKGDALLAVARRPTS